VWLQQQCCWLLPVQHYPAAAGDWQVVYASACAAVDLLHRQQQHQQHLRLYHRLLLLLLLLLLALCPPPCSCCTSPDQDPPAPAMQMTDDAKMMYRAKERKISSTALQSSAKLLQSVGLAAAPVLHSGVRKACSWQSVTCHYHQCNQPLCSTNHKPSRHAPAAVGSLPQQTAQHHGPTAIAAVQQ
jgi:hypothetical protein